MLGVGNCQAILTLDELNILLAHCPNLHVLAFPETWLNSNIFDAEISFPGFKIFRNDRVNRVGGSIAVYVRDSLSVTQRFDLESYFPGECILLEIMLPKTKSILFGTFYRPPSQADFMDPFVEVLDAMCSENKELIITGDFNCNLQSKIVSKESRQLKGISINYNLKQLVNQATRISRESSTLLDLLATNCPQNIVLVNTASLSL